MPKRWKCLLAGPPEAGKSTLCAALLEPGSERRVIKTQSPVFHKDLMVDLPGTSPTRSAARRSLWRLRTCGPSCTCSPPRRSPPMSLRGCCKPCRTSSSPGSSAKSTIPARTSRVPSGGWRAWACGGRSSRCRHSGPKRWSRCAAGLERTISSRAPEPGKAPELEESLVRKACWKGSRRGPGWTDGSGAGFFCHGAKKSLPFPHGKRRTLSTRRGVEQHGSSSGS